MALAASWEVLTVDDAGEADTPGLRKVDVAAVAEDQAGSLRLVRAELHMTPGALVNFRQYLVDEGKLGQCQ